ncbi:hypothetical protein [Nitrobacter sp. TKz-YC02]|uniref:hypothetical protein n=1 Tax=Nitrobacter sp. TKz-YC02 TaxID=3398704 RepID=UPI003CEC102C
MRNWKDWARTPDRARRSPQEAIIRFERCTVHAPDDHRGGYVSQRRAIQDRLDELRALLAQVCPAHGGIGHNRPPPDEDSPQVTVVVEIKDAEETIRKT